MHRRLPSCCVMLFDGKRLTRLAPSHASEGFILVPMLWIVMLLAVLATIYATYIGNSALALSANDGAVETEAVASAALELTAYQLILPRGGKRPAAGAFRTRVGGANVEVRYASEASRIDLNAAAKPLLSALFEVLGAPPASADLYADRIIGWRTEPKPQSDDEASLYRAAGLPYGPRGAPFAHVGELWLVQGLPPALVERALPFVTVYSAQSDINISGAAPEVIAALPNMTPERLNDLLNQRDGAGAQSSGAPSGAGQPGTTTDPGNTFRVTVRMAFDGGRSAASEAVILVDNDVNNSTVPYHVLSWRDDIEMASERSRIVAGVR